MQSQFAQLCTCCVFCVSLELTHCYLDTEAAAGAAAAEEAANNNNINAQRGGQGKTIVDFLNPTNTIKIWVH